MATITTRDGLKQYALRYLGAPVLEINVDDDQLEDRIDEALEYWRLYHPEGIEQVYAKYLITASRITIVGSNGSSFTIGETITGSTSGATATITEEKDPNKPLPTLSNGSTLIVANISQTNFIDGETITGSLSTQTAVLAPNAVSKGVYDNKYITLPDLMYGVTRIIPFAQLSSSKNMFDLQYQLRLHDLYDVTSTSMIYYKTIMNHLSMLDFELNAKPDIRFNRFTNKLYLDIKWAIDTTIGQYVIVDGYGALDPATAPRLYNELWLKHYTTALFKKQWALDIKKFQGIQLPGGVTLDGDSLYNEATNEIKDLEDELMNKAAPLSFFLG